MSWHLNHEPEAYSCCALTDLKKLGYMTTPVIVIDGSIIVGFDLGKIDKAVGMLESPTG